MSPKHRKEKSEEDVLQLRDLDGQKLRAMVLGLVALVVLVYAMAQLMDALNTSLDQQEEVTERLKALRQLGELRDAKSSTSEPAKI